MRKLNISSLILFSTLIVSCSPAKHYDVELYRTTMQFHDDFKVMQLTDIHLGHEGDVIKQLKFIETSIKEANPDLIVLTGDSFMFANTSMVNALFTTLNNVCNELSNKNEHITKFAFTYGNHDNQGDYHRYYINETIKKFVTVDGQEKEYRKYAAFIDFKDDDLYGLTNYHIDLVSKDDSDKEDIKYRLNIIDSNSYYFNGFKYEYDVIHEDQLNHAKNIYEHYDDKEYIGLAFFHIPFEEFATAKEQYLSSSNKDEVGRGEFGEGVSDPYINNGSYQKLRDAKVHAYFVGHDHVNYSDIIFNATSDDVNDKALFSYGVKSTEMIYHDDNMIGYKLINLKENVNEEEFLTMDYVNKNIINVLDRGL